MAKKQKTDVNYNQRRSDVMDLRVRGMSFTEISKALGVPRTTVWRDVTEICAELKAQQYDGADTLRTQAAYRIEQLMNVYYPQAMSGDLKATDMVLKMTRELATLFSLNMPEQSNISIDDNLKIEFVGPLPMDDAEYDEEMPETLTEPDD